MPGRSGGGTGDGLCLPRMLPTFSRSQTSSMVWPLGISNWIDSPCPTSSPRLTRRTSQPALASRISSSPRSSSSSTRKENLSIPIRESVRSRSEWWSSSSQHLR